MYMCVCVCVCVCMYKMLEIDGVIHYALPLDSMWKQKFGMKYSLTSLAKI